MDSPESMIYNVASIDNYSEEYIGDEEYRGDAGLDYFVDQIKSEGLPKFKRMVIENTDKCSYRGGLRISIIL